MSSAKSTAFLAILLALAAILLFWGLADKYLWQDEAATALLADHMLKFGRPLAYDGVNLVTLDFFTTEDPDTISQRTTSPQAAIDYYVRRGDLKPDTSWKWHPWGQFVVAALSLRVFGHNTLAARLPFALAALATVLLFYRLVKKHGGVWMALLATVLLVGNTYWILHSRQCRYYSLSSLLLVLTLLAYFRWQQAARWGATLFVFACWCWFQVDYGTVWPAFAILFLDALLARRRTFIQTLAVNAALAVFIAPFFYYYELWGRKMAPVRDRHDIFYNNLFNANEYVAPVILMLAAAALVAWRWKRLEVGERHLVAISSAFLLVLLAWVPLVAPESFLRYLIMAAPLGGLLGAWVFVRGLGAHVGRFAWLGTLVLLMTPLLSLPLRAWVPADYRYQTRTWWRYEHAILLSEIFGDRPDPNRLTVEWLRRHTAPSDQILVNYEDLPLAFYLPNPIRGGITAFRAEDDSQGPPQFMVLRQSVDFYHKLVFERELSRYQWDRANLKIPDVIWGNNPDPMMWDQYPDPLNSLTIARRIGE